MKRQVERCRDTVWWRGGAVAVVEQRAPRSCMVDQKWRDTLEVSNLNSRPHCTYQGPALRR